MKDPIRTQLARYESRLLAELGHARGAVRAATRRVQEIEADLAGVREALNRRTFEQQVVLEESRGRNPEAVSATRSAESS